MNSNFKLMSEEEIKDVLDKDLLELLGMQKISDEKKIEFYEEMTKTIQNRVIVRIDNRLNDAERQEWLELIDKNDQPQMAAYLQSKDIDVDKFMVEEAVIYKAQLMSLVKQTKE